MEGVNTLQEFIAAVMFFLFVTYNSNAGFGTFFSQPLSLCELAALGLGLG
jgi:hypothetical protein